MTWKIPVWVDCDPGHDDAFALILAAQNPAFNLLGVSTVVGNCTLPKTTRNALSVLTAIKRTDVSVFPGAEKPFCREHPQWGSDVHGKTGIDGADDLPEPGVPARTDKLAVIAMAEALLAQPKGTPWLVLLGSFTNIAIMLSLYPEVANHIKGLTIMGGAVGNHFTNAPPGHRNGEEDRVGNSTWWAEFNAMCDPEASRAIFSNPHLNIKTTLIPLDVTHLVMIEEEVIELMLHGPSMKPGSVKPSESRKIFTDLLKFFRGEYRKIHNLDGPLHDPIAVAVILDEEGVEKVGFNYGDNERFSIDLVLEGEQVGRTVATKLPAGAQGVKIPRGLDVKEFWRVLERALAVSD
ncbi:Inosine/uridine-preferring nucleoside hydrolase [Aureobasidium pullulans]|nr:Inosine/uridine-preferring nucleoside hydrolase [Aureobasidium pullulans]